MKRLPAFFLSLAMSLGLLSGVAHAADPSYSVVIDGRPLTSDPKDTGAYLHSGVVFVDAIKFTKAFTGLVSFTKTTGLRVSIAHHTADFLVGRPTAVVDRKTVKLAGAPFTSNGDIYVPITAIAGLARARVQLDAASAIARVSTGFHAAPGVMPKIGPAPKPSVAPTGP
jgi:hypothetical protein